MVRFDRITMQGFKSFANKVTIPFQSGFNVIAGPNGSGKSNVIDGLQLVLGTTSARSIRANKLQNLLFNGSRDRKPADYCEVSMYLDNSDGKIPNMEKEIKITRRITRSGISIYKLNGRNVTRSKIIDMLVNGNLSPEGYNIIMQGDVTRVIEMNPHERRGIIDDISGIAEFDEKKEKAQRELEKVENHVRENMIVMAEKQRLVLRLKTEKENAEKYQKFEKQLKISKASHLRKKKDGEEKKISLLKADESEKMQILEKLDADFSSIQKTLEESEKNMRVAGDEIIKKSRNYDVLRKIDSLGMEIIRKKDRIDLNEREITRMKSLSAGEEKNIAVREIIKLGYDGVFGTFSSLIDVPQKYAVALEVVMGKHSSDIIVSTDEIATRCIKYLKERKIGRARFIPLNKIRKKFRKDFTGKFIGYAIDLIKIDSQFYPAAEYILGNTLVVDNIETARRIRGYRIVTLDGDLVEKSGAMMGGFYRRRKQDRYSDDIRKLEQENSLLEQEIEKVENELDVLRSQEKTETEEVTKLQNTRTETEQNIDELRKSWKNVLEQKQILQSNIGKLRIEKARVEASLENINLDYEQYKDVTDFIEGSIEELQESVRRCLIEINKIGPVNIKAIEEYDTINVEFEVLEKRLNNMIEEKDSILKIVNEVEKRRYDKFMETLNEIAGNFSKIYKDLANGTGTVRLEEENKIESGLIIEASPLGKKVLNLDSMSGGEKTLTSLAFLFAIMQHYHTPFYVLDEIDAALDKANTHKIVNLIKKYSSESQFIVISHNDFTIQEADCVFGVSIEDGVSKVFGIRMPA